MKFFSVKQKIVAFILLTLPAFLVAFTFIQVEISKLNTSHSYPQEFSEEDYFVYANEVTIFSKEQFDLLVERFPEKYSPLKEKLQSFNYDMKILATDSSAVKQEKGYYSLMYIDELFQELTRLGIELEEVTKDYDVILEENKK